MRPGGGRGLRLSPQRVIVNVVTPAPGASENTPQTGLAVTTFISAPSTAGTLIVKRAGRRLWRVQESDSRASVALLHVVRLNRAEWRICDTARDEGDPLRLLGYIERLARDEYEVLWLVPPRGWSYVSSFGSALAALGDRSRFDGEIVARRAGVSIHSKGT